MLETKNIKDLGIYISLIILNNKLYNQGIIDETIKNKIQAEINSSYQKISNV